MRIELFGLKLPEIKPGDDIAELIVDAAVEQAGGVMEGDVIVVASKVISKAEGLLIKIDDVKPSRRAMEISEKTGINPKVVQIVLDNSDKLLFVIPVLKLVEDGSINFDGVAVDSERAHQAVKEVPSMLIVTRGSHIYSDAGIDFSNHPEGVASIPPEDPDRCAREIRMRIRELTGRDVAVIVSDTEMAPFLGSLDIARGASGIEVITKKFGELDIYGKPKFGGIDHTAHELACAAALLMGQTSEMIPAVLVRGLKYRRSDGGVASYQLNPEALKRIIKEIVKATIRVVGMRSILSLV